MFSKAMRLQSRIKSGLPGQEYPPFWRKLYAKRRKLKIQDYIYTLPVINTTIMPFTLSTLSSLRLSILDIF